MSPFDQMASSHQKVFTGLNVVTLAAAVVPITEATLARTALILFPAAMTDLLNAHMEERIAAEAQLADQDAIRAQARLQ